MYATHSYARRNKLVPTAPRDRKPVSARRPGDGMLADEARAKLLGREAEKWLFSDDSNWLFSFLSICGALDLCPQYIRQGLKRWHGGDQKSSYKKFAMR